MCCQQWLRSPSRLGVLLLSGVVTISGAALIGCEEANHDLADPPQPLPQQPVTDPPMADPPVTVDPVNANGETAIRDADVLDPDDEVRVERTDTPTDVRIDVDRETGIETGAENAAETRQERREERRERLRETLDNVNIDVDGGQTDVQIGDGEVDVDTR